MKNLNNKNKKIKMNGFFVLIAIGFVTMFFPTDATFANVSEKYEGGKKYTTRFDLSFEQELTDWEFYLHQNPEAALVYNTFSKKMDENGKRIYSDEFIVGLLANISCEGAPGSVESSFSICNQYGFCLPSGGKFIKTIEDVDYLLEWPTSNNGSKEGYAKKGSCGVSSVQWSFDRRVQWCSILKNVLESSNKTDCSIIDFNKANKEMFFLELLPDGYYYKNIQRRAKNNGGDVESYAEAICDVYEVPSGADLDMSGTGKACKTRRAIAKDLWAIFISTNVQTYDIITPENNVTP